MKNKKNYTFTLNPEIVERFLDKYAWKYFLSKSEFINRFLYYLEIHPELRKEIYGTETVDVLEKDEGQIDVFEL